MIEGIGELTAQKGLRAEQQAMAAGQESVNREMSRTAVHRPVEASAEGQGKSQNAEENEAKTKGRYNLEHGFPVYEKYDRSGELILQLPPVHDGDV